MTKNVFTLRSNIGVKFFSYGSLVPGKVEHKLSIMQASKS